MKATIPVLCFFHLVAAAAAHEINTSYTLIEIQPEQITCSLRVDQTDLEKIFDLDEDGDGATANDEFLLNLDAMQEHFHRRIALMVAGDELPLSKNGGQLFADELGNRFVDFQFSAKISSPVWKLTLRLEIFDDLGPRHKNLVKVIFGSETVQAIFTIDDPEQSIPFEGRDVSLLNQIGQFIWLGMEHIFIGYDHILFLMGLIVLGGSFRNLIKIVTAFTAAHSITLILAALQIVLLPTRLVESVIALSIVYIAVENFLVKDTDQRWLITFIFGLMHGFGFASVLTELGLPTRGLAASLLSFNVGVEIGQVVIVAVAFPIILWINQTRWQRQVVYGLSSIILIFGLVWFFERALQFNLPVM
jgi:hydrogenase/urease accessory protein HupE